MKRNTMMAILFLCVLFPLRVVGQEKSKSFDGLSQMQNEINQAGASGTLNALVGRKWTITYTGPLQDGFTVQWKVGPPDVFVRIRAGKRNELILRLENLDNLKLPSGDIKQIKIEIELSFKDDDEGDPGEGTGENFLFVRFKTADRVIDFAVRDAANNPLFTPVHCREKETNLWWEPEQALTPRFDENQNGRFVFVRNVKQITRPIHLTLCYMPSDGVYREAHATVHGLAPETPKPIEVIKQTPPRLIEVPLHINLTGGYPWSVTLGAYTMYRSILVSGFGPFVGRYQHDGIYTWAAGWMFLGPDIGNTNHGWTTLTFAPHVFSGTGVGGVGMRVGTLAYFSLPDLDLVQLIVEVAYRGTLLTVREGLQNSRANDLSFNFGFRLVF